MPFFDRVQAALGSRAPLAKTPTGEPIDPAVLTATAALLVAAAYGDDEFVAAERRAIQKSLRTTFGISREQAVALLADADAGSEPETDLVQLATALASSFDSAQRQRILGLVWTVVYADLVVDDAEVAFAGQVTRLLGLTAEQSQEARDKAFQWFSTSRSGA